MRGRDEAAQVLQALAAMRAQLAQVVRGIRSGSESVANAAVQIAAGNQDLAERTTAQAGALEEQASAMEQLTASVEHSAANASEAQKIVARASDTATQGGELMAQVVRTMDDIHSSAGKMADIIGLIDGIAFQTNILGPERRRRGRARGLPGARLRQWWPARCARWPGVRPRPRARSSSSSTRAWAAPPTARPWSTARAPRSRRRWTP
ncbi:methyl-accepting chemotaxis sensory transducer [Alicycliphilus sp. B1]|nr:methyl-accepting chemotaxis sensory transducer [Alicycliphilus sp. B1]